MFFLKKKTKDVEVEEIPTIEEPIIFPKEFCPFTEQIIESFINKECFSFDDYKRWRELKSITLKFGSNLDIFHNVEYIFSDKELDITQDDVLLDVGSGSSLLPRFFVRNVSIPITVCDYDDYGFESQKYYFKDYGQNKFQLLKSDAADTGFADNSFTKISATSCLQNFEEERDSIFIKESYRLLQPKGCFVATVPYAQKYIEDKNVPYYHKGFERRYNEEALKKRLFSAAPFKLKSVYYMNPQTNDFTKEIIKKYFDIGNYFRKWYEGNTYMERHLDAIWYTLLLIRLDPAPNEHTFGCCFTLEK